MGVGPSFQSGSLQGRAAREGQVSEREQYPYHGPSYAETTDGGSNSGIYRIVQTRLRRTLQRRVLME